MTWTTTDLDWVRRANEIDIAPLGPNGDVSRWVTIWVVTVDDQIVVRSYRGNAASWYRAARTTGRGHLRIGSIERAVTLESADRIDPERVDVAYRAKYGRSSYVDAMVSPAARTTTLRLEPTDKEQP